MGGVNGDGDGLLGDGGLEGEFFVDGDVDAVGDSEGLIGGVVAAGSADTLVWVLGLEGDSGVDDVVEGVVHETAVAALVAVLAGAVNELLLGEALEVLVLEEVGTLQRAGGREGPA